MLTPPLLSSAISLNFAVIFDATSVDAGVTSGVADAVDVADMTFDEAFEVFSSTSDAALCLARLSMSYAERYLSLMEIWDRASVVVDVDVDRVSVVRAGVAVFLASDILLAIAETCLDAFADASLIRLFIICPFERNLLKAEGNCSLRGVRVVESASSFGVAT